MGRHWHRGDLTSGHALVQHRHDRTLLGELSLGLRIDLTRHGQLHLLGGMSTSLGLLSLELLGSIGETLLHVLLIEKLSIHAHTIHGSISLAILAGLLCKQVRLVVERCRVDLRRAGGNH